MMAPQYTTTAATTHLIHFRPDALYRDVNWLVSSLYDEDYYIKD